MSADPVTDAWAGFRDDRTYRTELTRLAGNAWVLTVDAQEVAEAPEQMGPGEAQDWARSEMGEGVDFLPGDEGGTYWVANPERPRVDRERADDELEVG